MLHSRHAALLVFLSRYCNVTDERVQKDKSTRYHSISVRHTGAGRATVDFDQTEDDKKNANMKFLDNPNGKPYSDIWKEKPRGRAPFLAVYVYIGVCKYNGQ